jgi:hypothetical protein
MVATTHKVAGIPDDSPCIPLTKVDSNRHTATGKGAEDFVDWLTHIQSVSGFVVNVNSKSGDFITIS